MDWDFWGNLADIKTAQDVSRMREILENNSRRSGGGGGGDDDSWFFAYLVWSLIAFVVFFVSNCLGGVWLAYPTALAGLIALGCFIARTYRDWGMGEVQKTLVSFALGLGAAVLVGFVLLFAVANSLETTILDSPKGQPFIATLWLFAFSLGACALMLFSAFLIHSFGVSKANGFGVVVVFAVLFGLPLYIVVGHYLGFIP